MICAYCGTELPAAAMFCGECGRAVATKAAAKARPRVPVSTNSVGSRWPSLVAEHQVDPMVALSAQPGLVEVDLLASGPIVIPVANAPVQKAQVAESPTAAVADSAAVIGPESAAVVVPEEPDRPLPEVLVAAALAAEERAHSAPAVAAVSDARDEPISTSADIVSDEFAHVDSAARQEYCQQCGAELAASDIFCGECGFVRRAADLSVARPRDTATYDPFPWGTPRATEDVVSNEPEPASAHVAAVEPTPAAAPVATPIAVAATTAAAPGAAADADDPVASEAVQSEAVQSEAVQSAALQHEAMQNEAVQHEALQNQAVIAGVSDLEFDGFGGPSDVEKTRIVDRPARGDAFILQFSTGENITVSGTGLIGRNPLAEPGEYFDSLVSIVDPGKSVSKTHLEFGQDGGQFWISDRYSANGTVVREPDRPARRGEAGKRYRVVRGTRVDIGEQFFIVS